MAAALSFIESINAVIWHDLVLYVVLGVGVLFTFWSGLGQYRSMTHGVRVLRGVYDDKKDAGAINHFQALSTALSATVGLGNIAGVAIAISLGGPGAVFWMWVVGLVGMALKMTEVTQAMLFRDLSDPDNPRGGAMYVCRNGFRKLHPALGPVGAAIGGLFCLTLLVSAVTGGNMFQAWNVADISESYFGVPPIVSGIVMTLVVGMVILGGIKRIGGVTGRLVPFMCGIYILAGLYVILINIEDVPAVLALIVTGAFSPSEGSGAFVGGAAGFAFLKGMQRALFSNEAGQGSAPIAHSAAKTNEPVREGVVAGLEPFIDTLCVCTITALAILLTGVWNREPTIAFIGPAPEVVMLESTPLPAQVDDEAPDVRWTIADARLAGALGPAEVFCVVEGPANPQTGGDRFRVPGRILAGDDPGEWIARFDARSDAEIAAAEPAYAFEAPAAPSAALVGSGVHEDFKGATLTAKAFDSAMPGLGLWIVPLTVWLFAVSTIISWSYYGEQAVVYLFGQRATLPYRIIYCLLILIAVNFIRTEHELDVLSTLGTGVMLWANIPIMLIFGSAAMKAYHDYFRRLRNGEMNPPDRKPPIVEVVEGRDVR